MIADDQTLMRDGLKTILKLEPDIEVAGTAVLVLTTCDDDVFILQALRRAIPVAKPQKDGR